ncbi:hypothetical protein ACO0QE_000317 [Hanseniaspora vineae]
MNDSKIQSASKIMVGLSKKHADLLNDPSLTETNENFDYDYNHDYKYNYKDIMDDLNDIHGSLRDNKHNLVGAATNNYENNNPMNTTESLSGNSVVITKPVDGENLDGQLGIKDYIQKDIIGSKGSNNDAVGKISTSNTKSLHNPPSNLNDHEMSTEHIDTTTEENESRTDPFPVTSQVNDHHSDNKLNDTNEDSEDQVKSYQGDYSDSDFEEELEKRLLNYTKDTHKDYVQEHKDHAQEDKKSTSNNSSKPSNNFQKAKKKLKKPFQGFLEQTSSETGSLSSTPSTSSSSAMDMSDSDGSSHYDEDHIITFPSDEHDFEYQYKNTAEDPADHTLTDIISKSVDKIEDDDGQIQALNPEFRDEDYDDDDDDDDEDNNSDSNDEENDDEEDEDEEEDLIPPPPPPKELDPDKLYALYPFQGPDPSHCNLQQDEACSLLNDQDGYWWLVKRCSDGKIGFAPAEILETFPERLARLNCWKNEQMNSMENESLTDKDQEQKLKRFDALNDSIVNENGSRLDKNTSELALNDSETTESTNSAHKKNSDTNVSESNSHSPLVEDVSAISLLSTEKSKNNGSNKAVHKTVSFNNVISYMESHSSSNNDSDNDHANGTEPGVMGTERLKFDGGMDADDDDDRSEVVSDVSWNQMPSLHIGKVRKNEPLLNDGSTTALATSSPCKKEDIRKETENADEQNSKAMQSPDEKKRSDSNSDELHTPTLESVPFSETFKIHKTPALSFANKSEDDLPEDDQLTQIFVAPPSVFAHSKKDSAFANTSPSPSIGEYSPSSSEFTNDSPPIDTLPKFESTTGDSTAIGQTNLQSQVTDYSNSRFTEDHSNNNNNNNTEQKVKDDTLTSFKAVSNISKITNSPNSSDVSLESPGLHPLIHKLYDPVFNKFDELLQKIEESKSSLSLQSKENIS